MTLYNDELIHYGVKGMKWGRRKSDKSIQETAGERDARINNARFNVATARGAHRRAVRKSVFSTSSKKREYYKKDAAVRKTKLNEIKAQNKERFKLTSQDVALASTAGAAAASVLGPAAARIAKTSMNKVKQQQNKNLLALEPPRSYNVNDMYIKR